MAKAGFYAVAKGRVPGIYASWDDCEEQVKGFNGAKYKKFRTLREAEQFVGIPSTASTSTSITSPSRSISRFDPVQRAVGMSEDSKTNSKPNVSPEDAESEEGYDVVYADGACKGNGQVGSVAGVGVWWGHNDPRNIAERCPGAQTNNRAELIAIVRVLEQTPPSGRPLMIKTDSTYSIKCLREWHQSWDLNGWKTKSGKPVLNAGIIRYLLSLLSLRHFQGSKVKFVYVKGHAGIEGNEGADRQANLGTLLPKVEELDWDKKREKVEKEIEELELGVEVNDKVLVFYISIA
ncbi:uncharacterized protein FOMMEDRAFT_23654 [Fomitiporia mediterranea MF3/22]|uniref:uncharacterized protein n=1 Tax=Fomitiporia mediterranea (strain MF3/22) TaxID=694068 RepID=UPI00044097FE|nr:uncharacterized protein FOMMEDRAFT_23654 [Fomitiporia mediterranea MF3/22]EJC98408.1 hypothetical protein FOMMEDRAFT_23654 [Fomitiporia mediterranea MF3/22]